MGSAKYRVLLVSSHVVQYGAPHMIDVLKVEHTVTYRPQDLSAGVLLRNTIYFSEKVRRNGVQVKMDV